MQVAVAVVQAQLVQHLVEMVAVVLVLTLVATAGMDPGHGGRSSTASDRQDAISLRQASSYSSGEVIVL